MDLVIDSVRDVSPAHLPVEIVERKGLGHPDTICDALAEELGLALCREYLSRTGTILHHNVDKALLVAGEARPSFGGGTVTVPMGIVLAGRATPLPGLDIDAVAHRVASAWLSGHLHALDVERHVALECRVRPGSSALQALFQSPGGVARANDTSIGVGFAPLTDLERAVLAVERAISSAHASGLLHVGEDVKVLAVRRGGHATLTIGCALVDRHVRDTEDYLAKRAAIAEMAADVARRASGLVIDVVVNAGDVPDVGAVYITVTGTSAESADDGQVGRGNRVNGLITPHRPMVMEAAAGKNPRTHVGKLYSVAAGRIAHGIAALEGIESATCTMASQIGRSIEDPQVIDLRLRLRHGHRVSDVRHRVEETVDAVRAGIGELWKSFLAGSIQVY